MSVYFDPEILEENSISLMLKYNNIDESKMLLNRKSFQYSSILIDFYYIFILIPIP